MMNELSRKSFREFLETGKLGRFTPTLTVQEAFDICESLNEEISYSPVGQEGIMYGRLFICGEWGPNYQHSQINRIGVDFWTLQPTKLLEEIPWYEPLSKMSRHEVYALLRKMGVSFFEVVRHLPDGTSFSEEISIGQIPLTLLCFYTPTSTSQEISYHITWFRDGLDEGDSVELREPSE